MKDSLNPHGLQVGDFARNIESGWLGKITEISQPREVKIDYTSSFYEQIATMIGVDMIVVAVTGCPLAEALSDNDTQCHDVRDLAKVW